MSASGVYRTDRFGGEGVDIDLRGRSPLDAIARALDFPSWYGGNWDALEDCLSDLSWRKAPETILVFRNFAAGDELGILIEVLSSAAEFWAEQGGRFAAVFVDPQRALELPEWPGPA